MTTTDCSNTNLTVLLESILVRCGSSGQPGPTSGDVMQMGAVVVADSVVGRMKVVEEQIGEHAADLAEAAGALLLDEKAGAGA